MREVGRAQQGFFPTPDRVVRALARQIEPAVTGQVHVLDAGCGEGAAIALLRQEWMTLHPKTAPAALWGVESDRGRAATAEATFKPTGGSCLWSAIEDAGLSGGCPGLLWFNPPYDRVRGAGREETMLFGQVTEWAKKGTIVVLIVPLKLFCSDDRLACDFNTNWEELGHWRFPDPEFTCFGQCVVAGRYAKGHGWGQRPSCSWDGDDWGPLPDTPAPSFGDAEMWIAPAGTQPVLRQRRIGLEIARQVVENSPVRGHILRAAQAHERAWPRPLLPLRPGHRALALGAGQCDGIVEQDGQRFIVKGRLATVTAKVNETEEAGKDGKSVTNIKTYKTQHVMTVRALREDGSLEEYSTERQEQPVEVEAADGPQPEE
jgi:hypothetical protein